MHQAQLSVFYYMNYISEYTDIAVAIVQKNNSWIFWYINAIIKKYLSTFYGPGTVLSTGKSIVNNTDVVPALITLTFYPKRQMPTQASKETKE